MQEQEGYSSWLSSPMVPFHPDRQEATYIRTEVVRVECKDWRTVRQADIGFADPRFTNTRALKELKQIAIDGVYVGKDHYLSIVLDVVSGAVVFVGDGKGSEALEPFWQRLRLQRKVKIEAVAIDMSPAYIKAVRKNLKEAVIVFDHFHVIKLFNEKVSDFRRRLFNSTRDVLKRRIIKGTRWLLLTAREKLQEKTEQAGRLNQALEINKPLATVYYMKEDLRQLWYWVGDKKAAEWHLLSWIAMARGSGVGVTGWFCLVLNWKPLAESTYLPNEPS